MSSQNRVERLRPRFGIRNILMRNLLCEFVCTWFLLFYGLNSNAQIILQRGGTETMVAGAMGWGLALMFAAQLGYMISGSQLNPAVSMFLWTFGDLSFKHFLFYSLAQTCGAFTGALSTYLLYYDKIWAYGDGQLLVTGVNKTAHIFTCYPKEPLSLIGAIYEQLVSTAMLAFMVEIICDKRNKIPKWAQPAFLGIMLLTLELGFNLNSGLSINPARDIGPRLFTLLIGYGHEVFSYWNYNWFWIQLFCPFIGALVGSWSYQFCIGLHIPDDNENTNAALEDVPKQPTINFNSLDSTNSKLPLEIRTTTVNGQYDNKN